MIFYFTFQHIKVIPPVADRHFFWNRKGFCSINAMVVCDSENIVNYLDCECGGSFHDQMIFSGTPLYGMLSRGEWRPFENAILAGDSGYESKQVCINFEDAYQFLI